MRVPLRGLPISPRAGIELSLTDPSLERSRVFFDIEVGGVKAGRVAFELVSSLHSHFYHWELPS